MVFVGNDIVDLLSPFVRGKHRDEKFVRRVLSRPERYVVTASRQPDIVLQVFWAAKETAFKAVQKIDPDVTSASRRYEFTVENRLSDFHTVEKMLRGYVQTPRGTVYTRIYIDSDCVHCIGATCQKSLPDVVFGKGWVKKCGPVDYGRSCSAASARARILARRKIASVCSRKEAEVRIVKSRDYHKPSIPRVCLHSRPAAVDISLSHDGRLAAYAFVLPPGGLQTGLSAG